MPEVRKTLSLHVETEETVILSPESRRFKDAYRRIQPREAGEVREILGISAAVTNALRERGEWRDLPEEPLPMIPPEALDSRDGALRQRAWDTASTALTRYVYSPDPQRLRHMEPLIARYLEVAGVLLHTVTLADIEVAKGATLTISTDTHLVSANMIIIHGNGRIACSGFTKFAVASIEGVP
jgi:hypothetical protein